MGATMYKQKDIELLWFLVRIDQATQTFDDRLYPLASGYL